MYQTPDNLRLPDFCQYGKNGLRGLPYVLKYGMCVERIRDDDPNGIQPFYGCNRGPGNGAGTNDPFRRSPWGGVCHVGYQAGAELAPKPSTGELIHVKPFALSIRVLALLGALAFGSVANAVEAPVSAFTSFMTSVTGPGKQTVTFSKTGTPVLTSGVPTVTQAGAQPLVTRSGSIPLGGGARLPITAVANVPSAGAALLLGKAFRLVPVLGTGIALYDLAKEYGFDVASDTGSLVVRTIDTSVCTVGPCVQYVARTWYGGYESANYRNSKAEACAFAMAGYDARAVATGYASTVPSILVDVSNCTFKTKTNTFLSAWGYGTRTVAASPVSYLPSTIGELEAQIAADAGWPSGSAVGQALVDAAKATGEDIPVEQPKITGPASVVGPVEKSTTGNTETTKQSNYDCVYVDGATVMDGGSVACTEKIVTSQKVTTVDPVTGATTTTTTTENETVKSAEIVKDDKPAEDPCDANPDRLGCITGGTAVAPDLRKETSAVTVDPVAFAAGSGCPSPLSFTIPTGSYSISYQPLCDRLFILKALFVAMGAFIAAYVLADSFRVT